MPYLKKWYSSYIFAYIILIFLLCFRNKQHQFILYCNTYFCGVLFKLIRTSTNQTNSKLNNQVCKRSMSYHYNNEYTITKTTTQNEVGAKLNFKWKIEPVKSVNSPWFCACDVAMSQQSCASKYDVSSTLLMVVNSELKILHFVCNIKLKQSNQCKIRRTFWNLIECIV